MSYSAAMMAQDITNNNGRAKLCNNIVLFLSPTKKFIKFLKVINIMFSRLSGVKAYKGG